MIVLSFLWITIKFLIKLPVLLCLGIVYSVVGMIRGIYQHLPRVLQGISCTCICCMPGISRLVWNRNSSCACGSQCNSIINV